MYQSLIFKQAGITAILVLKKSKNMYDLNITLMEEVETLKFLGGSGT